MQIGSAVLRAVVGGLFVGHGTQKLAGWFGGHGLKATGESFESMAMRPGVVHAGAAGLAEAGGGALLAAGAATPLGAAAISTTMITAIRKVHGPKGPWVTEGGYEYNLVLLAVVFALTAEGPGRLSLDARRGRARWGLRWAIGELGAAALASAAAVAIGGRADRAAARARVQDEQDGVPRHEPAAKAPEHDAEEQTTEERPVAELSTEEQPAGAPGGDRAGAGAQDEGRRARLPRRPDGLGRPRPVHLPGRTS